MFVLFAELLRCVPCLPVTALISARQRGCSDGFQSDSSLKPLKKAALCERLCDSVWFIVRHLTSADIHCATSNIQAKDDCPLVLVVLAFHFLRAFSFPVTIYTSTPRPESQYASA